MCDTDRSFNARRIWTGAHVPFGLMQSDDVNRLITPGKVMPLINYSVIVEQHDGEVAQRKLGPTQVIWFSFCYIKTTTKWIRKSKQKAKTAIDHSTKQREWRNILFGQCRQHLSFA
jgi:hypothetical protein